MRFSTQLQGLAAIRVAAGLAAGVALLAGRAAIGAPLAGEALKFDQEPLNQTAINGQIYWGHDQSSTAQSTLLSTGVLGYSGGFVADDFSDNVSQPVVHVTWWGSYINSTTPPPATVPAFLLSFESDVPANTNTPYSTPGTPLVSEIVTPGAVTPGSGKFSETAVSAGGAPLNETLYEYDAELAVPFPEVANTVYWLKIAALTPPSGSAASINWGWHDRDYTIQDPYAAPGDSNVTPAGFPTTVWHYGDDAVQGLLSFGFDTAGNPTNLSETQMTPLKYIDNVDGPSGIGQVSQDQAFQLYYAVPEPSTVALGAMAGLGLLRRRRRARVVKAAAGLCMAGACALGGAKPAAAYNTGNILTNPGFETNALTSDANVLGAPYSANIWGDENSTIVGPTAGVTPLAGAQMMDMLTDGLTATQTFQLVDITPYASVGDINAGNVTADFGAYFNVNLPAAATGPGIAGVNMIFEDSTHSTISQTTLTTGNIFNLSWQNLSQSAILVPANTQYIIGQVLYFNASMTVNNVDFPGFVDQANLDLTVVPEPASMGLAGLLGAGLLRKRRRA